MIVLESGEDLSEAPGGAVVMWNSSFENNIAKGDSGGVLTAAENSSVTVEGDGNVFKGNNCGEDGGVFQLSANTLITIEGGNFTGNTCDKVSKVQRRGTTCQNFYFAPTANIGVL